MKKVIFTIAFILVLSISGFSQDSQRFSRPHDTYPENARNDRGFLTPGYFIPLPYPYLNYNISIDTFPQNEPSVKFNAKFPNNVVASWRDFSTGVFPAIRRVGFSYSTNSGTTWSASSLLPVVDPIHPRTSDPAVCSDTLGNFYIATISIDISNGNGVIIVYKSTDGGVTFPLAYTAQGNQSNYEDKEWIACDLTTGSSAFKNNLYISWTRFGTPSGILLTKSTNGGVNWTTPVQVSTVSGIQGSEPAIGPNGEVYVVYVGGNSTNDIIYFNRSINGGATFTPSQNIAQGISPIIPITSSGVTFPSIAVDLSGGPGNGTIYVTWCDSRNGDPDIFLIKSTNQGNNWSSPVRVNSDAVSNGKLQCWPWISINEQGNLAILFYDSRNSTSTSTIEAWLARSTDGGVSFINEKLSSTPFTANWPNTDVRFGDYINVDYRGTRIVPVWTDLRAGGNNMDIYTAIIDLLVGIKPVTEITPYKYQLSQNYPNPFNPETNIRYEIPKNGFVKLIVYNILGREVETLVNENQSAGAYEVSFDGSNLSSGPYFYKLQAGDFSETKKMLLIK
jgi:hypothetical protein